MHANRAASASVYFNGQRPAIVTSGAGSHGWLAEAHRIAIRRRRCVCACACVCVRACVRACVRDVFAIYDNNISPRLIMIIIKNTILYFIQVRHTDDFPPTGTRLVLYKAVFTPQLWDRNGSGTQLGARVHTCSTASGRSGTSRPPRDVIAVERFRNGSGWLCGVNARLDPFRNSSSCP